MSGLTDSQVEAQLRAGFAHRAGRTLDGHQVRIALAAEPDTARTRPRTWWIATAAAAVVIFVGLPAGWYDSGPHPAGQLPEANVPALITSISPPPVRAVPDYRPTWLPSGFTELLYGASADGTALRRMWGIPPATGQTHPVEADLAEYTSANPQEEGLAAGIAAAPHAISVNGHRASVRSSTTEAATLIISWLPTPGTVLQLSVVGADNATAIGQQIAESVREDPGSTPLFAMSFGALPVGYQPDASYVEVGLNSGVSWMINAGHGISTSSVEPHGDLQVEITDSVTMEGAPPGSPVTVRGRSGSYRVSEGMSNLNVFLADGRWLTMTSGSPSNPPLDEDQLTTIANSLNIGTITDPSWQSR